jgi:hypothetical protein
MKDHTNRPKMHLTSHAPVGWTTLIKTVVACSNIGLELRFLRRHTASHPCEEQRRVQSRPRWVAADVAAGGASCMEEPSSRQEQGRNWGEPILPLLGVLGEAKPSHQPGCQAARARSLEATRCSPKPASTGRSRGERLDACSGARGRLDEDEWIAAMSCHARPAVRRRWWQRRGSRARPWACHHRGPWSLSPRAEWAARGAASVPKQGQSARPAVRCCRRQGRTGTRVPPGVRHRRELRGPSMRPAHRSSEVADAGKSARRSRSWHDLGVDFCGELWICGWRRPPAAAVRRGTASSGCSGGRRSARRVASVAAAKGKRVSYLSCIGSTRLRYLRGAVHGKQHVNLEYVHQTV